MIDPVVTFIEIHLIPLGPPGLAVAAMVEELIAPLPSPVVMTLSGFFFLGSEDPVDISFWLTLVFGIASVYALAATAASLVWYFLARQVGKAVIDRWGKFLGVSWTQVEKVQARLNKTNLDEWSLFFFRVVPIVPGDALAMLCGAVRFNLFSYLSVTFIGLMIRTMIFALIGWQVGERYREYSSLLAYWENMLFIGFLAVLLLVTVGYLFYLNRPIGGVFKRDRN